MLLGLCTSSSLSSSVLFLSLFFSLPPLSLSLSRSHSFSPVNLARCRCGGVGVSSLLCSCTACLCTIWPTGHLITDQSVSTEFCSLSSIAAQIPLNFFDLALVSRVFFFSKWMGLVVCAVKSWPNFAKLTISTSDYSSRKKRYWDAVENIFVKI